MAVTPKYTHQIVALVTEPDGQALRAIAEAEEVSLADVIRDAVTLYLGGRAAEGATRAVEQAPPPMPETPRIRRVQEILNTRR